MISSNINSTFLTTVLVVAVSFSSAFWMLGILFLFFGLIAAGLGTIRKYRSLYLQGKITRSEFLRNTALDILGILIAVTLAGLLGRYLTQIVTVQISHDITRIVISILIVIPIGTSIGLLVKRTWGA